MVVSILIPFVLPSLISVLCCSLQAGKLLSSRRVPLSANNRVNQQNQREITRTILMLTTAFFICNTTFFTTTLALIFGLEDWEREYDNRIMTVMYGSSTLLPFLNTLVNPVIFVYRGAALRQFVCSKISSLKLVCKCLRRTVELIFARILLRNLRSLPFTGFPTFRITAD